MSQRRVSDRIIMKVPSEILGLVFRSLEKSDLSNVRLVCKSFEEAADPLLFDQIYISSIRTDLEIANLTVLRFGRYVHTLVFASTHMNYTWDEVQRLVTRNIILRYTEPPECFHRHWEHSWTRYTERRAEWREVNESGELLENLCFVLGKMPQLQTIKVTVFPIFKYTSAEQSKMSGADFACSRSVCTMHEKFRNIEPIFYGRRTFHLTDVTKAWRSLTQALSLTKVHVKELISDHRGRYGQSIPCGAFTMSHGRADNIDESFRELIKIQLNLTKHDYGDQTSTDDAVTTGNVAKILVATINLEQLYLESDDYDWAHFESILGGCRFSNLKSLKLSYIISTEDQLLDFLRSSPDLKHLTLVGLELTQGLWEHVMSWIKFSLQLRSVHFGTLLGGLGKPFIPGDMWNVDYDEVEDFILRNGENPLGKEAFGRTMAYSVP